MSFEPKISEKEQNKGATVKKEDKRKLKGNATIYSHVSEKEKIGWARRTSSQTIILGGGRWFSD
jgi:hypothetical protein